MSECPDLRPAPWAAALAEGSSAAEAWWVAAEDGTPLRLARLGQGPRGTILIFSGRTEFVEKYGRVGKDFEDLGFASASLDWRGQGASGRLLPDPFKGHVGHFEDYQQDVEAFLAALPAMGLSGPYFLVAHSMGGAIGLRSLYGALEVEAAVFSAPMWDIHMNPLLHALSPLILGAARILGREEAYVLGTSAASYVMETAFKDNALTEDAETYAWLQAQLTAQPEMALGGPTFHWVGQAMAESRALLGRPAPQMPCVTFLGSAEEVVSPSAIRRRMASWPGGRLIEIPGGQHEVMMERPDLRKTFFEETVAHFAAAGA